MRHLRFIRAFLFGMFRPKTGEAVARVAVFQNMKLGDMVCTTPLFVAIKKKYPRAHLVVIGNSVNRELLAGHPNVDEYVVDKNLTAAALRALTLDTIIFPGPNPIGLALAHCARIPRIISPKVLGGVCPQQTWWYSVLINLVDTAPHRFHQYAPREYLKLLEHIKIGTDNTTKSLALSHEVEEAARKKFETCSRPLIGISPSAGNKVKQWPAHKFAEVASVLAKETKGTVVLLGGAGDASEAGEFLAKFDSSLGLVNTVGALSIEELKATIKQLDIFIASDTGPIYVAEAFEVPTVDIVGPVDEREQPPIGLKHKIVLPRGRKGPYLHVMNARIHESSLVAAEVERTHVDDVLKAARDILYST